MIAVSFAAAPANALKYLVFIKYLAENIKPNRQF